MKLQKYMTAFLYILLVLACFGIAYVMHRLADPSHPERQATETDSEAVAAETKAVTSPSDAEETQEETQGETQDEAPELTEPLFYLYKPCQEKKSVMEEEELEIPGCPPQLMIASDLHYYSADLTDGGEAFQKMIAKGDGKTVWYSDAMIDALLAKAIEQKPSILILAGDNTSFGERENHIRLAGKLADAQAHNLQILVIPGNHDINSHQAEYYYGDEPIPAESVGTDEFVELYEDFGYRQALSRDKHSLSYIYELDDSHWIMMLDTCQYDPVNQVNGRIPDGTLGWIKAWLTYAKEHGIQVLPVGHHNLLFESRLFINDCTIENHGELIALFESYQLPVYISGHLHAQRVKRYQKQPGAPEEEYRITEIVLGPYSIPECRYGLVFWDENQELSFQAKKVSVSQWAADQGIGDPYLLAFDDLAPRQSISIIKNQVKESLRSLPKEQIDQMAELYAKVYYNYTKGNSMERGEVERTEAWLLWDRMEPDNPYKREITKMLDDCRSSHLEWQRK